MIKMKFWEISFLSTTLLLILGLTAFSQELNKDYTGSITQYNSNFTGIGPKVYFLPPPKSKTEQLIELYESNDRKDFAKKIIAELRYNMLLQELKNLKDNGPGQHLKIPTDTSAWQELIARAKNQFDHVYTYSLLNAAGLAALEQHLTDQGTAYLQEAITIAAKEKDQQDLPTLLHNLAAVQLYTKEYEKAARTAQEILTRLNKSKNYSEQADAWMQFAMANSGMKNYNVAEPNIIRKAIPLYNKAKNFEGKIIAWQQLAQVYYEQNKYTQAQWFLLQAQQLAKNKNYTADLAEIEYVLASSKLLDNNINIAKKEFLTALILARNEKNKHLELAVLDKLGEVYITLKEYEEAENTYQDFSNLKAELKKDTD